MKEIIEVESAIVDPRQTEAYNSIVSRKIPKSAIKSHPGKQGMTFTYIDHVWITETLQNALGNLWSWDVISWEVFEDSVIVTGKLTLHIPMKHASGDMGAPKIFDRTVTEVGTYDRRKGMSIANTIASAASRALCRCTMRMFGIGLEFYKKNEEQELRPEEAWGALKQFAINQGSKYDDEFKKSFGARLKEVGISNDNILDRYEEAYKILAEMLGKGKPVDSAPEE